MGFEEISQNTEKTDTEEFSLDLGLSSNNISIDISKETIKEELEKASIELEIDKETIKEFFEDFKQQILDEKEIFYQSLENKDYESLHKSAHKLKGVGLNLRLEKLGNIFKEIDELSKDKEDISTIKQYLDTLYSIIESLNQVSNLNTINSLTITINIAQDDKKELLKSLNNFLESIKDKDIQEIKEEINNAFFIVPIEELKIANELNSKNELISFIETIQNLINKEV